MKTLSYYCQALSISTALSFLPLGSVVGQDSGPEAPAQSTDDTESTSSQLEDEIAAAEQKLAEAQAAIDSELAAIRKASQEAGESAEDLAKRGQEWKEANAARLRELAELVAWLNEVAPDGDSASSQFGFANVAGGSSLAVGFNNHVLGFNATAIGEGLVVHGSNTTAVGTFNATAGRASEAIFVVGIGHANSRANALEVYANGDVVLPTPSSAIPMYSSEH